MTAQGMYLDGVTGANTADGLDPTFAADPAAWISRRRAEAAEHKLIYGIANPQGRVEGLYASNCFPAMRENVLNALCSIPEPWLLYTGHPPADQWRSNPTKLTMPAQSASRVAGLNERRAWASVHLLPFLPLSKIRYVALDYSQNDAAGLAAIEAWLKRHEQVDVIGETAPDLPHPDGSNKRVYDAATMLRYPSVSWMYAWDTARKIGVYDQRPPTGITVHLVCVPLFQTPDFANPINFPNLVEIAIAASAGHTIGLGGGWRPDQRKAIMDAARAGGSTATEPAAGV